MTYNIVPSYLTPHWQGALWKIFACFFFAANNGVVKLLSKTSDIGPGLSSYQIAFLQNFIGFMLMVPFIVPHGKKSLKVVSLPLHIYRVIAAFLGILLWYMALYHMPIAEAVALCFTGPIFTVIGARMYLKEEIGFYRYIGIFLGFAGAFVITRPDHAFMNGGHNFSWATLFPIASAVAIAVAKLLGRELGAKGESAQNLTFYLLFFMAPLSLIPALFNWTSPTSVQWLWIILLGILSAAAHYTTSHAYRIAEVTFLAPFGFARLIFSAAIGFMAFGESITSFSLWIGAAIIMISSLSLSFDHKWKRKPKTGQQI
ncbi:MAG: DMT family transporter [Janthinobacterium lividum]